MRSNMKVFMIIVLLEVSSLACQLVTFSVGDRESVRGSGTVTEETRTVNGIKAVEVGNQGNLYIELGDTESLVIEAEDNLIDYITSDVRNGTLRIGTKAGLNIRNSKPINYYLTVISLEGLSAYSSGDIDAPSLEADRFTIDVNSSGDITLEALNANRLDVEISSSGNIRINDGEVATQDIRISSSGNYDALDLESQEADVRLSSSGNANINVQDRLGANLSSSGNVNYVGSPDVTSRESSSGKVIER